MSGWYFHYSDEEWNQIAAHMTGLTWKDKAGAVRDWVPTVSDRHELDDLAGGFVGSRQNPSAPRAPAKAKAAWLKIAKLANQLDLAIKDLSPTGAADFTVIDNHRGRAAEWAGALPEIASFARDWAAIEARRPKARSNNKDELRDWFIGGLIGFWQHRGGGTGTGYDAYQGEASGPLIRFLLDAAGPAFGAVGLARPTPDALRSIVCKYGH